MKNAKQKFTDFFKKFRFIQGVAIGLTASSFLAYGVVTINSFTAGTSIVADEVNANFSNLKTAVEQLQGDIYLGFLALGLNAELTVTCDDGIVGAYVAPDIILEQTDNAYDSGTKLYTATKGTVYQLMVDAPYTINSGTPHMKVKIFVNGSPLQEISSTSFTKILKLNVGDTVKIELACSGMAAMGNGQGATFNTNQFIYSIKKY